MADSYRGLTITIGGDTTKLSKALKSANQAIAGTQSELRRLGQALKLDPTSLKASELQMGALAAQASNTATRVLTLNKALKEIGESVPKGATQTIEEMAKSTDNVRMNVELTREKFVKLTENIAKSHTEMSKMTEDAAKALSENLGNDWKIDTNIDEIKRELDSLPDTFKKDTKDVEEFEKQLERLQRQYSDLKLKREAYVESALKARSPAKGAEWNQKIGNTDVEIEELEEKFQKLVEKFTQLQGIKISFDNENVDFEHLEQVASDLFAAGEKTGKSFAGVVQLMHSLEVDSEAFKETLSELTIQKLIAEYSDLTAEEAKAAAEMKSYINQLVDTAKLTPMRQALSTLDQKLKDITKSGSEAKTRLKETLDAISGIISRDNSAKGVTSDEGGFQTDAMRAYADVVGEAQAKVANLQEQISKYTDERVIELANSMTSLRDRTDEAEESYRKAETAVQALQSAINSATQEKNKIETNTENFENNKEWQALVATIETLNPLLDKAKEEASAAKNEWQQFVDAGDLREKNHDLTVAKQALEDIANINVKPEIDVSEIDGLKASIDAITKGMFDNFTVDESGAVKFFSDLIRDVEVADTAVKNAKESFDAFLAAAKADPGNEIKEKQAAEALKQLYEKLAVKREALNKVIANTPSDKIDKSAIASGTVTEEYEKAKKAVEEVNKRMEALKQKKEQLASNRKAIKIVDDDSSAEAAELDRRIDEINADLEVLRREADGALDRMNVMENTKRLEDYKRGVVEVKNAVDNARSSFEKLGEEKVKAPKVNSSAFMQSVQMITQAARRMASEVIQSSNEIDSAYRDMRKTVSGTEQDFASLKDAAIEYSQSHFTSADTMLEMQALGGQLGILIDDLGTFGEITSNLDIATDIGAEDIALQLGQMANVMQLDITEMQGFADALVRLGNNMPAQESRIMNVAQRFAAVASTANFSGSEILAWSAAIASTGQRSEAAATAIGNTVSAIEQAVVNGGSDLKQFAAIAEMSAEEFKAAWKEDPTEALRAFIQGLQTLKDSDESAVAALENMGITGVRMQQTLLGLSQTIDSLDDALAMSSNAWDGISDQWGDAGDAAREAQNKSEGFSGTLAILKNNAQNLAETLGDGLVPAMHAASEILRLITDILNDLPGPFKEAIVIAGGAAIAFGTIGSVLTVFANGMGEMMTILGSAGGSFATFASNLLGIKVAAEGAAAGVGILGASLSALGIAAVVIGILAAVSALNNWCKEQERLQQATEGLETAMSSMTTGYEDYANGAKNAAMSLGELKDKTDEVIEKQANLAQSMSEEWADVGKNAAMVDEFADKITTLSEKARLTKEEQGELTAAVRAYNDLTGASVEVIDAVTGKLNVSTEAIERNAAAWKERAENEVKYEQYKKLVEQRIEDEQALKEAEEALAAAEDRAANSSIDMYNGISSASIQVSQARAERDRLKAATDSAREAEEEFLSTMDLGTNTIAEMRRTLVEAGESTEDFDSLTDAELRSIAANWHGSVEEIIEAVNAIKAAAGDAEAISAQLEESSKAHAKQVYNDTKAQYDAEYKELKRTLDAKYKERQRAYDKTYKAQQREFDRAYKDAQRAYDAEYKQVQKAYDAEYKALQKQLDKQYKARQKELDAEYKQVQKSLDQEYDSRKKVYDAELKALKKSLDAEADAFKKATDAKLKEMEKEYKAKLKLLELEYGQKDSDLDEQIKALEAETEAEKKAIEERKQNEKLSELQKAVDQAKSRRTRAEAEKNYNDYVQEIEQKRNEESRKLEEERLKEKQEALKEELEQRKEILKAQYDDDVAAYKEKRQAELDALKEANDIEYEAQKEYYDLQLEQLKEAQTAQLEAIKEEQTAELESLKESQTAQLESVKEAQQASLEALKLSQQDALEAIKQGQQDELDALKQSQQEKLDNLKESNQKQLDDLKAAQKEKLDELKNGNTDEVEENKATMKLMTDEQIAYYRNMTGKASEYAKDIKRNAEDSGNDLLLNAEHVRQYLTQKGEETGDGYDKGVSNGLSDAVRDADPLMRDLELVIQSPAESSEISGHDFISNFMRGVYDEFNNSAYPGLWQLADIVRQIWGFSVPKKGPMHHQDEWGGHFMDNILDGMRSKEGELYKQVDRMARAMEEGFDPMLSVDAAYDAIDSINRNRANSAAQAASYAGDKNTTIEVNVNLSNVSFRSDADIEKLANEVSQRMAAQVRRQQAGRL